MMLIPVFVRLERLKTLNQESTGSIRPGQSLNGSCGMPYRSPTTTRLKTWFIDISKNFAGILFKAIRANSLRWTLRLPYRRSNTLEKTFTPGRPLFIKYMETQEKFSGLSRRHVQQIIRRKMIQRSKPSGKVYDRKKFKKDLP